LQRESGFPPLQRQRVVTGHCGGGSGKGSGKGSGSGSGNANSGFISTNTLPYRRRTPFDGPSGR